ncbi:MAG: TerB family tellurite resistance protein [Gemmobacter sp.]
MFSGLLNRLLAPVPETLPEPECRLALAALMVRVARADGDYATAEVARIDRLLAARYGLDPDAATRLRAEAEVLESEAPDTVRFTRALKAAVPLEDRAGLVEALWSVALTDGRRDDAEDRLMRMVANLLGITDRDSALARQRAARDGAG